MKYKQYLALIILACFLPLTGYANEIISSEEKLTLTEVTQDDLYAAAPNIDIQEVIDGDALLIAQNINVTADITKDIFAIGDNITIRGNVGDDIHVIGRKIVIDGNVEDDVFVMGFEIEITENATVNGNLYAMGERVAVKGDIKGDARINALNITIASNSTIEGNLFTYNGEPAIEEGAAIQGEAQHQPKTAASAREVMLQYVNKVVALFLVVIALLYITPRFTRFSLKALNTHPLRSSLTGIAWIVALIPVVLILFSTWVGMYFAIAIAALTVILSIIATGTAALWIGYWTVYIINKIAKKNQESLKALAWPHAIVGAVMYKGLQYLDVITGVAAAGSIGTIFTRAIALIALGAIIMSIWHLFRHGNDALDEFS